MASNYSKTIEMMRERYLNEYKNITGKEKRIAFFEEIGESAKAIGAPTWIKFSVGMSAFLRNEGKEALALFGEAIALDPQFAHPWHGKGNVLSNQKRYDEALEAYEKAIALDPQFAHPWHGKGNVLSDQKRYDEALEAYEKAIALDPQFAHPWHGKGNVLSDQKRYAEALTACEKAIALDPEFAPVWHGKGNVLGRQKRYDEAIAAYDEAIALDPDFANAWHSMGIVLNDQKRYDEALAAFEKAITLDPQFAPPWHGKGNVLSDQKRYDEALAAFDEAIALDPQFADPWHGKGNVLRHQKRYDEALAAYEKAIALDSEFADAWHGKGNVLSDQKCYYEALAAYEKAIALDSEFAHPWHGKGNVLSNQKCYYEALAAYEKAIALDAEYAGFHYNLGLLYWNTKRLRDALKAFQRSIELGLNMEFKKVAESRINRIERIIGSEEAGAPDDKLDEEGCKGATRRSLMKTKEISIDSWNEFQGAIDQIKSEVDTLRKEEGLNRGPRILYRGHSDSKWSLQSTLERHSDAQWTLYTYSLLALRCAPQIESFTGTHWNLPNLSELVALIKKDVDKIMEIQIPFYKFWVYLRQHGFPSPLLDWTASPYIAAFFALADRGHHRAKKASVIAYVDVMRGTYSDMPNISVQGPYVSGDKRHFLQQSWYSVCTQTDKDVDARNAHRFVCHENVFMQDRGNMLFKIFIPSTERSAALSQLHDMNINHFSLFQSEDSLMKALSYKEIDLYGPVSNIDWQALEERMKSLVGMKIFV